MESNTDNTFDNTFDNTAESTTDAADTGDRAAARPRSLRFWIRAINRMTPGRAERHAFRALLKDAEVVSPAELAAATATLEKLARAAGWTDDVHVPRGGRERHGRGQREHGASRGHEHHGHGYGEDPYGTRRPGVGERGGHQCGKRRHGEHQHAGPKQARFEHGCQHGERGGFHAHREHAHRGHTHRGHKHRLAQHAFERGFAAGFHHAH